MLETTEAAYGVLRDLGWSVSTQDRSPYVPAVLVNRYSWLPANVRDFISHLKSAVSKDRKSWFLGVPEYEGTGPSAFAWNQWELDSIQAACGDNEWIESITGFWDSTCPILLSVRSRYSYLAVRECDLSIVSGAEPEYEEPDLVASTIDDLFVEMSNSHSFPERWF